MTVKEFYDLLVKDETLAGKLQACKTPDEAYAIAKEAGVTDSLSDFVNYSEEVSKEYKEMSPEEIDSVTAAGTGTITTTTTTTTVTASASAGVAAAV